jgi:hypothetical protein
VPYLNDGGSNQLYRIDPTTAAATLIGANGVSAAIDALPEPSAAAGLCAGALLLAAVRRSRAANASASTR